MNARDAFTLFLALLLLVGSSLSSPLPLNAQSRIITGSIRVDPHAPSGATLNCSSIVMEGNYQKNLVQFPISERSMARADTSGSNPGGCTISMAAPADAQRITLVPEDMLISNLPNKATVAGAAGIENFQGSSGNIGVAFVAVSQGSPTMTIAGGNNQTFGSGGQAFANNQADQPTTVVGNLPGQLAVKLTDAYGMPLANTPVTFSTPASPNLYGGTAQGCYTNWGGYQKTTGVITSDSNGLAGTPAEAGGVDAITCFASSPNVISHQTYTFTVTASAVGQTATFNLTMKSP